MNPYISDLFFSVDMAVAEVKDDKGYVEYDNDVLLEIALNFHDTIVGLGVTCPSPDELIQDFKSRI